MARPEPRKPLIVPLGDSALLVRFGDTLDEGANRAAIAFAYQLQAAQVPDVLEIAPNLVSVLVRFHPVMTDGEQLAAELRLLLGGGKGTAGAAARAHVVPVAFGGIDGPDLDEVAVALGLSTEAFVGAHNAAPLRVLAIGFAPGFAYCGFHPESLQLARRTTLRQRVPAGTVLFAAGQTAIAATAIPTGWHVIGRTPFANFDPSRSPPVRLKPGDSVRFEAIGR